MACEPCEPGPLWLTSVVGPRDDGNYKDYRGYVGIIGGILGLYVRILGLYRDNVKEHGNYYNGVI